LLTCLELCRLILTYLTVASLPLGYFPSEELLAEFDLGDQYENLLPALQVRSASSDRSGLDTSEIRANPLSSPR